MTSHDKFKKFDNTGKYGCITGACGLLGKYHAIALLETNANVILTDVDSTKLQELKNFLSDSYDSNKIITHVMDVTDEKNIFDVLKNLNIQDIGVDILINNAAINPTASSISSEAKDSRLEDFSLTRWTAEISVGLTGAFLCSKIFGNAMSKGKGGIILNIASDLSVIAPDQRLYQKKGVVPELNPVKPVTYSVIKTGLIGLTRYLATYWPEKGIRANALSPCGVYTQQDDEFVNKVTQLIPLGRMASPDEYVSAVQFLCSDASAYMNGQNIVIDGGRSVL